jgi:hypothetical protein
MEREKFMLLISMSDFVLQELELKQSSSEFKESVKKYAELLKQPLKLSMFVPCDEDDNPLNIAEDQYEIAKEKVIFQGFKIEGTYKLGKKELPYLTDGESYIFLHSDFAIRQRFLEDLVGFNLKLPLHLLYKAQPTC